MPSSPSKTVNAGSYRRAGGYRHRNVICAEHPRLLTREIAERNVNDATMLMAEAGGSDAAREWKAEGRETEMTAIEISASEPGNALMKMKSCRA